MFDTTLPQNEDIQTPGPATDDQADNVGLFLREIHHRLKNTLTLLGSWLRAYLRSTTSVNLPMARRIASSAHPWKA
jgi:two-component sensor histidine kinase